MAAHPPFRLCDLQRIRKRVEEAFGWAKTVAGLRKMRHRGLPKGQLAIHPGDGRLRSRALAQIARSVGGVILAPSLIGTSLFIPRHSADHWKQRFSV
jgi:hypothetical protein